MNTSERNLLAESDQMTESMLVRLEDWELAYLRVAMLHEVEETLNASIAATDNEINSPNSTHTPSPFRDETGVAPSVSGTLNRRTKPHPVGRSFMASELLEAAR